MMSGVIWFHSWTVYRNTTGVYVSTWTILLSFQGFFCHFIHDKFYFFLWFSNWRLSSHVFFGFLLPACLVAPARDPEPRCRNGGRPPCLVCLALRVLPGACRVWGRLRGSLPARPPEHFVLSSEASGAGFPSTERLLWALSLHCPVRGCTNAPAGVWVNTPGLVPSTRHSFSSHSPTLLQCWGLNPVLHLSHTPSPSSLFTFRQDLAKLTRLALDSWPSCPSPQSCWDCRCVPTCLAPGFSFLMFCSRFLLICS